MPKKIIIATRKSQLALWQAKHIQSLLHAKNPLLDIELLPMTTEGDEKLDVSLSKIGGKGLFIKSLEQAILRKEAHIAVHSVKDIPAHLPEDFVIGAICTREDVRDALVSTHYSSLDTLPLGAKVGTSSLRRQVQLKLLRPDLQFINLRGNVLTRLKRLDEGQYDAIVLASAGLKRLGLADRITQYLPIEQVLPACGQGALGIECRKEDVFSLNLIKQLHEKEVGRCVIAERAMNAELEGSCQVPIAAHAYYINDELFIEGRVGCLLPCRQLSAHALGRPEDAQQLGAKVAKELIAKGARELIRQTHDLSGE